MLIDTHCHLNFDSYNADRAEVMARAAARGVTRIINPSIDLESGRAALELAQEYAGLYVAVGVHPNDTAEYELGGAHLDQIEAQAAEPKVIAIGEIGLDYYRDYSPKGQQWAAFEEQLDLARRLNFPVIIHDRDAHTDVLAILKKWIPTLPDEFKARPGVLHSFSAPQEIAEEALALGFYLGFTGPITFKNAGDLRQVATKVPLDRLLVETDGPFLTPHPYRGKRNEPVYVAYTAAKLAELHGISEEKLEVATTANAERLFRLPPLTNDLSNK